MKRVIYSESQPVFLDDVLHNRVWEKMEDVAREEGIYIGRSELLAWQNNAPKIRDLLELGDIHGVQVSFEYCMPYNRCRIDCMIYGRGTDGLENAVHIELKQWGNKTVRALSADANFEAQDEVDSNKVEALTGGDYRICAHPSQQVRGYDGYLRNFIEVFSVKAVSLSGLAYCYNYTHRTDKAPTVLFDDKYSRLLSEFPTYGKDDIDLLASELKSLLANGDGLSVFNKVQQSRIMPCKKLLEEAGRLVHEGRTDSFALLQDQIVAKNMIMNRVRMLNTTNQKSVLIVRGGPGTGKTVIALHILSELARSGRVKNIRFATKSKPLLEGVKNCLPRNSPVEHLFSNVNEFLPYQCEENQFDVVLIDEAHRIQKSPNYQYMRPNMRTELSMVDMIIRSARLCVMFIDDKQAIRSLEIGSSKLIEESALKFGACVDSIELKSQFRCNGSDNYLDWLEQVLYNGDVRSDFKATEYDFRIMNTPEEVYAAIKAKCDNQNRVTARLMAGFCWPWSSQLGLDGDLVRDVKIGDFSMPWETKDTIRPRPKNRPEWFKWAYDPRGVDQVGCIYTAQGFEFDYAGVIIGPDLKYDVNSQRIITDRTACKDPVLLRSRDGYDGYVRNIYRVLMSRGMKGCYVYCCDKALAEHLKVMMGVEGAGATAMGAIGNHRILRDDEFENNLMYVDFLPVYGLRAACSNFGASEVVEKSEPFGWMDVSDFGLGRLTENLYIVQAQGDSMDQKIADGQYCVMEYCNGTCNENDIVLAEMSKFSDLESPEGAYVIKQYTTSSEKNGKLIILKPMSNNPIHKPIEISCEDGQNKDLRIVGVLKKRL